MRPSLPAALAFLALTIPLSAAKKADEEPAPKVAWDHPYLKDYWFDWKDERSAPIDLKEIDVLFDSMHTGIEFTADREFLYTQEYVLTVRDIDAVPQMLLLDYLDSARHAEILSFEGTFVGGGRTTTLDEGWLQEFSGDQRDNAYDDTILALTVPRDRPGKLTVKLKIRADPHVDLEPLFAGRVTVQESAPCVTRTITITAPQDEAVRFETRHFHTKPVVTTADGSRTWTYRFANLWDYSPQYGGPHWADMVPSLYFSNQPSVAALGKLYSDAWEPHLIPSPAIVDFAQELAGELETTREKALAVHDEVADRWGYLGFYPGESGWIPHDAQSCFEARLGDCKDQTALMIAAMRAVGLSAHPAIVWAGTAPTPSKVPHVLGNHAVVWVEDASASGGGFLVDSTDTGTGNFPVADWVAGRKVLVLDAEDPRYVAIPRNPRTHRLRHTETRLELDPEGRAEVTVRRRWFGTAANGRAGARQRRSQAQWERTINEELRRAFPGASIGEVVDGPDPESPDVWTLRATLTAEALVERYGDKAVVRLPWMAQLYGAPARKRIHPRVEHGKWDVEQIHVVLPPGSKVLATPGESTEKRDDFAQIFVTELRDDGSVFVSLDVEALPGRVRSRQENVRVNFYEGVRRVQRRPLVVELGKGE